MMPGLDKQVAALARDKRNEVRAFARAFATPEGKLVLEVLERELGWHQPSSTGVEGVGVDVNATLIRDGQKVAIHFIHQMRKAGSRIVADESSGAESEYTPDQR